MKVIHHTDALGIGGTEKNCGLIIEELNKRGRYNASWLVKAGSDATRLEWAKNKGIEILYYNNLYEFRDRVADADIVHYHRGGWTIPEFQPGILNNKTKAVETSVFGHRDEAYGYRLNWTFYQGKTSNPGYVKQSFLCPAIEEPKQYNTKKFNSNNIVFAKIQRLDPNIFHPGPHVALAEIGNKNITYLNTNPQEAFVIEQFNKPVTTITDDEVLSYLYCNIDLHLHSRIDGETFGCCIHEAAAHKVPTLTHVSRGFNNHIEEFDKNGLGDWVVRNHNRTDEWIEKILWAINELSSEEKRKTWGEKFYNMYKPFNTKCAVDHIEDVYGNICIS